MIASLLVGVVNSEPVQQELRQAIACKFSLVDENGDTVCNDPQYADGDIQSDQEKSEADEVEPIEPVPPPPTPTAVAVAEKSDPPWYECVLSIECIGEKAGQWTDETLEGLKKEFEEFQNASPKEKIKDILGFTIPGLGSFSDSLEKLTGFDLLGWMVDHPGAVLTNAVGFALLFVPGGQGVGGYLLGGVRIARLARLTGWSILGGSGVSGLFEAFTDGSLDDIGEAMFYGGVAGAIGWGVGGSVYKGVGSLISKYVGPFIRKWLPRSLGGGSGTVADVLSFDWLKTGEFNWKKAATAGGIIGVLTFGIGGVLDKAIPPMAHTMKQFSFSIEMGSDGTLAMPWFNKADDGVSKAVGKGGGTAAVPKVHPNAGEVKEVTKTLKKGPRKGQTVLLRRQVRNYEGEWITLRGGKRGLAC